jgi:galactofuranose transport system substrate-binding protein
LLAAALLLAFFLPACQSAHKNDGYQFVIGMSQCNLYEPWRIAMNSDIKKEALKYQNIKIVYRDAGGNAQKQANDIKQLLESGIDLLIVSMDDTQAITPVVKQASKTVPVITLSRTTKSNDFSLNIGNDGEEVGYLAGNMIATLLSNKKGNIVEIQGDLDSDTSTKRSLGLKDALQNYDKFKISRTLFCNWQLDETEEDVLESIKEDNTRIDVIFAYSDYMAQGAYNAVKRLGLGGIKIIGVDGLSTENGGIELIKKDIIQGTIICPTGGKEAVDYAIKILHKETNLPAAIILKNFAVTKSNLQSYLSAQ